MLRLTDVCPIVLRNSDFDDLGLLGTTGLGYLLDKKYVDQVRGPVIATADAAGYVDAKYGLVVADDPETTFWDIHHKLGDSGWYGWDNVVEDASASVDWTTRIGKDGFEHHNGKPVRHFGGVRLARGVTIGAQCAIDRSLWKQPTCVGEDTHIDNLVHIAHNVQIGKRCRIAAGAIFAGSVVVGDDVFIGIGVLVRPTVHIGDGAFIGMGVAVLRDVAAGERLTIGNSPHRGPGVAQGLGSQGAVPAR